MVAMVPGRIASTSGPPEPTFIVQESGRTWIEAAPLDGDQVTVRVACAYFGDEILTVAGPPGTWLPVVCPSCRGEHMVRAAEAMAVCRRCENGFCCGHCSCCRPRGEVDAYDVVSADGEGEHSGQAEPVLAAPYGCRP